MICYDEINLIVKIQLEGSNDITDIGEKMLIDKLKKFKEKLADNIERVYETVDIDKLNKRKQELNEEIAQYIKSYDTDHINFPETWNWDNISKEGELS